MSRKGRRWQPGPAELLLATSIGRRFYVQGASKLEIAEEFGISRFKVARILDQARDNGLIRVEFDVPAPLEPTLSDEVATAYGLRRVLVLERAERTEIELRKQLGAMAAELLTELVTEDDVLGVVWARTVNAMTDSLRRLARCPVVQLCGVSSRIDTREHSADRSVETVRRVAQVSGGEAFPIFGPLVLPDRRTAQTLRQQPGIADAFERFARITTAVVSIGAWRSGQSTVYSVLGEQQREELARRGAVAEVAARLFDADGNELTGDLGHHVFGVSVPELKRVPEVIALSGGAEKADAIAAVLRSGMVDTLVTDASAAERLLEQA
ncbi:DNA-binding transcriptional regulator LsrR (DeoR family) [Prauserella isguenensis]|uniref:DNA-binding transcriptional regulator LsrR (DeoR family) n=1 Tax=Prauserella isguenensis TaxID=1470180 RepID=A0A839RZQ4_9PSEU|nr:sugar-binding domain-containing protein [Prauserella isguenensis]MBB3049977.1 DNA-binding transcriptional regulator LsrR (DeoR family) [Prauserella isguenensis]